MRPRVCVNGPMRLGKNCDSSILALRASRKPRCSISCFDIEEARERKEGTSTVRRIWAPTGKHGWGKDFQWMSVAEFHRTFTVRRAVAFLEQIKKTLQKEA